MIGCHKCELYKIKKERNWILSEPNKSTSPNKSTCRKKGTALIRAHPWIRAPVGKMLRSESSWNVDSLYTGVPKLSNY